MPVEAETMTLLSMLHALPGLDHGHGHEVRIRRSRPLLRLLDRRCSLARPDILQRGGKA